MINIIIFYFYFNNYLLNKDALTNINKKFCPGRLQVQKGFLGVLKFNNLFLRNEIEIIPLGGINNKNLLMLNLVKGSSLACLSVLKKKPANFINRLF